MKIWKNQIKRHGPTKVFQHLTSIMACRKMKLLVGNQRDDRVEVSGSDVASSWHPNQSDTQCRRRICLLWSIFDVSHPMTTLFKRNIFFIRK